MIGASAISAMIASIKANDAMRRKNNFYHKKPGYIKKQPVNSAKVEKATKEQLENIRKQIKSENRKETQKSIVIAIALFCIIGMALFLLKF
jgi:hypothetical protein